MLFYSYCPFWRPISMPFCVVSSFLTTRYWCFKSLNDVLHACVCDCLWYSFLPSTVFLLWVLLLVWLFTTGGRLTCRWTIMQEDETQKRFNRTWKEVQKLVYKPKSMLQDIEYFIHTMAWTWGFFLQERNSRNTIRWTPTDADWSMNCSRSHNIGLTEGLWSSSPTATISLSCAASYWVLRTMSMAIRCCRIWLQLYVSFSYKVVWDKIAMVILFCDSLLYLPICIFSLSDSPNCCLCYMVRFQYISV